MEICNTSGIVGLFSDIRLPNPGVFSWSDWQAGQLNPQAMKISLQERDDSATHYAKTSLGKDGVLSAGDWVQFWTKERGEAARLDWMLKVVAAPSQALQFQDIAATNTPTAGGQQPAGNGTSVSKLIPEQGHVVRFEAAIDGNSLKLRMAEHESGAHHPVLREVEIVTAGSVAGHGPVTPEARGATALLPPLNGDYLLRQLRDPDFKLRQPERWGLASGVKPDRVIDVNVSLCREPQSGI